MKEVAEHREAEDIIAYNLRQQELLSNISQRFHYTQSIDNAINSSLGMLGNNTGVSRVYIFEDIEGKFCRNTFEWCNKGIKPEMQNLQKVPYEEIANMTSILAEEKIFFATDIKDLPEEFYNHLHVREIKSLLTLPIFVQESFFGFIGFDECQEHRTWKNSEIELLRTVSNIIASGYERKIHFDKLKQYQFMVESANDAIFFKDLESRYVIANKKTLEVLGLPAEQVIGKNDYEIMKSKEQAGKNVQDDQDVFTSGKAKEITKRMAGNNGKEYWFQAIKVPQFDDNGKVVGLVGIARDITRHREMETELRHSQKMAAIGTLAGGLAHEFNNLLFMITGNVQLLSANIKSSACEDCQSFLEPISRAAKRATNLVRQVLTFSRKSEKKVEDVDLVGVIREGMGMLRASLPTTIEIVDSVGIDGGMVRADSSQLYQLLVNLCANSKYVLQDSGGTIEIGLYRETRKNQPVLKLTVRDDGPGMPPEVKDRVLEPFFTTKPVGDGSGMGLSVVHGIVEDYGGDIEIESAVGQGTSVHVYLPEYIEAEEKAAEIPPAAEVAEKKSLRIMVVDDEPELCDIMTFMLETLGQQVEAFPDGESALAAFTEYPDRFDLVFTDQAMPKLSGKNMAVKMLKIRPDIPIVLITGYSDVIDPDEAEKLGFLDYLYKPFDVPDFEKVINRVRNKIEAS